METNHLHFSKIKFAEVQNYILQLKRYTKLKCHVQVSITDIYVHFSGENRGAF